MRDANGASRRRGEPRDCLDILVIARHPYGGRPPLGDWQMARALAREHRVLYVEPPLVLRPAVLSRREQTPALRETEEGVTVVRPYAFPGAARPRTAWASDRWLARQIRRASALVFEDRLPMMVIFDPLRGTLPRVPRQRSVYWRRDRLADLSVSRRAAWLGARDRELLRHSDLVSCTALTLVEEAEAYATGRVQYLPNGCDAEHFAVPQSSPVGFPGGQVVIGFVGGAFWRLDNPLIDEVARLRPDWALLFVGDEVTKLPARPNIVSVGYTEYGEIPAWMQHLDVGMIPYDLRLAFNHGSFPIKAYEYLAAGIPAVSTPLPALAGLEPYVRFASDPAAFVTAVEEALASGPTAAACRAVAADNTWGRRAEEFAASLRSLSPAAGSPAAGLAGGRRA